MSEIDSSTVYELGGAEDGVHRDADISSHGNEGHGLGLSDAGASK